MSNFFNLRPRPIRKFKLKIKIYDLTNLIYYIIRHTHRYKISKCVCLYIIYSFLLVYANRYSINHYIRSKFTMTTTFSKNIKTVLQSWCQFAWNEIFGIEKYGRKRHQHRHSPRPPPQHKMHSQKYWCVERFPITSARFKLMVNIVF